MDQTTPSGSAAPSSGHGRHLHRRLPDLRRRLLERPDGRGLSQGPAPYRRRPRRLLRLHQLQDRDVGPLSVGVGAWSRDTKGLRYPCTLVVLVWLLAALLLDAG